MKELTSKNLDLLSKIATLKSSMVPYHEDLKCQITELRGFLEKSENYNRLLSDSKDSTRNIEQKYHEQCVKLSDMAK